MEAIKLNAKKREVIGKRVKTLRAEGLIPAVVYGHGIEPKNIAVVARDLEKAFKQAGESTLVDLVIDDAPPAKVLIQDVQFEALKGHFLHVDFRQVNMNEKLETEITLKFVDEAPAVRELGGTFVRAMDAVAVRCLPQYLVHEIEVSIAGLKAFDDSLTVADIKVPEGIEIMTEPDQIIAVVNAALTEDEIKAMEAAPATTDVSAVKVATEEKKAERDAAKEEEKQP